jgi:hypothetical protein
MKVFKSVIIAGLLALIMSGLTACLGGSQQSPMGNSLSLGAPQGSAVATSTLAPASRPTKLIPATISSTSVDERKKMCKFGEQCWVRVGANPFTGAIDDYLKRTSAPDWAKAQWRDQVVGNRGRTVTMPDGTLYRDQIYSVAGDHRVWRNVRQAVGRSLTGPLYKAEKDGAVHYLFMPAKSDGGCDNYSWLSDESASTLR